VDSLIEGEDCREGRFFAETKGEAARDIDRFYYEYFLFEGEDAVGE
jgi:hypothetical protein